MKKLIKWGQKNPRKVGSLKQQIIMINPKWMRLKGGGKRPKLVKWDMKEGYYKKCQWNS
jgi:hypothetical protein